MTNKIIPKSKVLSVFDFDGTITYSNSFTKFLVFAFDKYYLIKCMIRMVASGIYYVFYKPTQNNFKKLLIKTFLCDIEKKWFQEKIKSFCDIYWYKLIRQSAVDVITKELENGAEVTICSASPTLLLEPFAKKLGTKFIGTELEIKNNKLTGYILGYNCRCTQKVIQLEKVYGDLEKFYLKAWGDTRGDYELLAIAQEAYWRYFNKKNY